MMTDMKYIVTTSDEGNEEIFLFPSDIEHVCMAEALSRIKNQSDGNWTRVLRTPVSAGFVSKDGSCYGKSITLELSSREIDSKLLNLS